MQVVHLVGHLGGVDAQHLGVGEEGFPWQLAQVVQRPLMPGNLLEEAVIVRLDHPEQQATGVGDLAPVGQHRRPGTLLLGAAGVAVDAFTRQRLRAPRHRQHGDLALETRLQTRHVVMVIGQVARLPGQPVEALGIVAPLAGRQLGQGGVIGGADQRRRLAVAFGRVALGGLQGAGRELQRQYTEGKPGQPPGVESHQAHERFFLRRDCSGRIMRTRTLGRGGSAGGAGGATS